MNPYPFWTREEGAPDTRVLLTYERDGTRGVLPCRYIGPDDFGNVWFEVDVYITTGRDKGKLFSRDSRQFKPSEIRALDPVRCWGCDGPLTGDALDDLCAGCTAERDAYEASADAEAEG